jgi:hypothetical protein
MRPYLATCCVAGVSIFVGSYSSPPMQCVRADRIEANISPQAIGTSDYLSWIHIDNP